MCLRVFIFTSFLQLAGSRSNPRRFVTIVSTCWYDTRSLFFRMTLVGTPSLSRLASTKICRGCSTALRPLTFFCLYLRDHTVQKEREDCVLVCRVIALERPPGRLGQILWVDLGCVRACAGWHVCGYACAVLSDQEKPSSYTLHTTGSTTACYPTKGIPDTKSVPSARSLLLKQG